MTFALTSTLLLFGQCRVDAQKRRVALLSVAQNLRHPWKGRYKVDNFQLLFYWLKLNCHLLELGNRMLMRPIFVLTDPWNASMPSWPGVRIERSSVWIRCQHPMDWSWKTLPTTRLWTANLLAPSLNILVKQQVTFSFFV